MGSRVDVSRAKWEEPNAEATERQLRGIVQSLAKESVKFARLTKGSAEYQKKRDLITALWSRYDPLVAQLKELVAKEAKRSTRDALHHRLCEISREAETNPRAAERPSIAWKSSIDAAVRWLDNWTR